MWPWIIGGGIVAWLVFKSSETNSSSSQPPGSPPAPPPAPPSQVPPIQVVPGGPFDSVRASAELDRAVKDVALACAFQGGPRGSGTVLVTWDNSGLVTEIKVIGKAFEGTFVEDCIVTRFRAIKVSPFVGQKVTLVRDVAV